MQSTALAAPDALAAREPLPATASQTAARIIPIRTTFERYEFKYWMSAATAERVIRFISPYVVQDPVSVGSSSHQVNTSLYFDTPGFQFWQLHRMSAHTRHKLRIRAYGSPPSGRAFFEVKQKVKTVMLKVRGTVPVESIQDVLAGRFSRVPCAPHQYKMLASFLALRTLYRAEPKVLVSYRRTPFVSRIPAEDVRVTVDTEIIYSPTSRPELRAPDPSWIQVPGPFAVEPLMGKRPVLVELKFRGIAPMWMSEMVQRFRLRRTAFSKYVAAVTHLQEVGAPVWRYARG